MRFAQTRSLAFVASVLAVALSSCVTKREEMGAVRSSFGFDGALWGGQGGGSGKDSDTSELKSKWADAGWQLDEDGKIKSTRKKEPFSGKSRYSDKQFGRKDAKLENREVAREVYSTPEYLDRQKFKGGKTAKESKLVSRESNFDANRAGEFGQTARESGDDSPGFLNGLNPFRTKSAREGGSTFKTKADRQGSRAQANAAVPLPGPLPRDGNMARSALTMDDVKKMLSPESFD